MLFRVCVCSNMLISKRGGPILPEFSIQYKVVPPGRRRKETIGHMQVALVKIWQDGNVRASWRLSFVMMMAGMILCKWSWLLAGEQRDWCQDLLKARATVFFLHVSTPNRSLSKYRTSSYQQGELKENFLRTVVVSLLLWPNTWWKWLKGRSILAHSLRWHG